MDRAEGNKKDASRHTLPLGCGAAGAPAGCWEDEVGNKAAATTTRNVMRLGIVMTYWIGRTVEHPPRGGSQGEEAKKGGPSQGGGECLWTGSCTAAAHLDEAEAGGGRGWMVLVCAQI